jgi:hypothetical protein
MIKVYIIGLITVLLTCACNAEVPEANKESPAMPTDAPNIILINADDLGYGDVGCYGATKVQTPNIDRIAKEGRRFTDAHSSSAVCSPSRYGLMGTDSKYAGTDDRYQSPNSGKRRQKCRLRDCCHRQVASWVRQREMRLE